MTVIIGTLLFIFGMCLCVQLMAALYGIIDLWYTIRTVYPTVIRRILVWTTLCIAVAWLLGDNLRPSFLWGLIGYVGFYIWFFSELVGESLIDFQCKVAYITESIGFALNDFNFVIYPFYLTSVDGVIAVVEDTVTMSL